MPSSARATEPKDAAAKRVRNRSFIEGNKKRRVDANASRIRWCGGSSKLQFRRASAGGCPHPTLLIVVSIRFRGVRAPHPQELKTLPNDSLALGAFAEARS